MVSKKKLVPKLRFREFKNDRKWEQKRLEESVSITMGQSPSSKNYTNNPSDYILVQGNSDLKDGKVFPRIWTTQITKKANKGDLILSVRAPVGDIGKTDFEVVLGRGVAAIEGNEFIFQLLLKMKVSNYWSNLITGSTFESINSDDIREAKVFFPKIEEQNIIGSFFKNIDVMIQLQQSKVNKVKDIKSAYLSEMFPKEGEKYPKKRFEGFIEPWETGHLGQVTGINKGEQLNKEKMIKSGKYYVLNGGINPSGYTNTYNTKEQTISISEGGNSCGYVNYNEEKFWSGGHNYALTNPKIDVLYLYYFLKSRQDEIMSLRVGSGLPNIQITALSEFDILYPLRDEQEKIGYFFKNLDNQILIEEEKLTKLEKLKQAYLNDMFV